MSLPDTPKSRTWPFTSLEYPTPVKQRGHHVTAIGLPPTTSFTISCLLSNGTEYARASPSISTPSTSSSGPYSSPASSAETNEGLEIDGMASGGRRVTISYSRSGVGTGVGGGVLVAIGFAVFLCGVGVAVAVSGRGVGCPPLLCGAAVAVGAVAGVFGSGLADTVSARGVDVSGNGVSGAVVAVGSAAGVFVSGLADTVSDRGVDISGNGVPCAVVEECSQQRQATVCQSPWQSDPAQRFVRIPAPGR